MRDVLEVIKSRRSVRKYEPEQISQDKLGKIIEAGTYAPSAHNQQPWYFTVIQNQELLSRINTYVRGQMAESDNEWIRRMGLKPDFRVTYDAPTLIIVSARQDAMAWRVDCAAAIQNMLIAAESLGVGSVWLGLMRFYFENNEETAKLNIPEGYKPYYGVSFGYKEAGWVQTPPKRNLNIVSYIK